MHLLSSGALFPKRVFPWLFEVFRIIPSGVEALRANLGFGFLIAQVGQIQSILFLTRTLKKLVSGRLIIQSKAGKTLWERIILFERTVAILRNVQRIVLLGYEKWVQHSRDFANANWSLLNQTHHCL